MSNLGPVSNATVTSQAAAHWFASLASRGAGTASSSSDAGGWPTALTSTDAALLTKLTADPPDGSPNLLSQLTGFSFSASSAPDFLAVRTGANVTPEYAGGYSQVGWSDDKGNDVEFFATGSPPSTGKGVSITFGAGTSASNRQSTVNIAMQYLNDHLTDSQDAGGRWNQPTFDVRV